MTGTAMTEAEEFRKIYNLEVVAILTHKDMIRDDETDLVYRNEVAQVQRGDRRDRRDAGARPAGPGRYRQRREVGSPFDDAQRRGVKHETLNVKFHEKESGIVAHTGRTARSRSRRTWPAGAPTSSRAGTRRASLRNPPQAWPEPGRGRQGDVRRCAGRGEGGHRRGPRAGRRGRRPAHHRHRAPRQPADRQPAPRPGGPPRRPRVVAVLPVPRGRPDEAVRLDRVKGSWSASVSRTTSASSRA